MNEIENCPRCHAPLPLGTPPAQCPRCLLRLGFDTDFIVTGGKPRAKAPAPTPEELAAEFPQLEILEQLGRGGMGVVYKARQKSLERLVALKILAVDPEGDPSFSERFAREARALAALDHPSIVRVYDSGRAGEHFYFLMEFVDGTDLRRMLRAGRIAPREALAMVAQVCDALQYAHDQGVVHRDIKPENLLVDRRGRVKIADFGLAKIVGQAGDAFALTGTHQAMGTPHYMAPEQIEHPQDVDHRADIYSLGVVLYELLTGELPLGRFVPPSSKVQIDVRLDEVVLKALEKDPPRRYQHASEVKTEVESFSRDPGSGAPHAAGARHGHSERRRHWVTPAVAGLAVLLFVYALILIGVFWIEPRNAGESLHGVTAVVPLIVLTLALVAGGLFAWRVWGGGARVPAYAGPQRPRSAWPWVVGCLVLLVLVPLGLAAVGALFMGVRQQPARQGARTAFEEQAELPFLRELPLALTPSVEHGPFCFEVDGAREIRARVPRMAELVALAERPGLTSHEQAHLAAALLEGGFFDENADGLLALIEHQELAPDVARTIRAELGGESPSANKTRVLDALARKAASER